MPLESETASEPNITENYDNLSIDELKTKLESEEENVTKLTKEISAANEKLKKKEEEAKVPLQEYDDAQKEWERLEGIYQDKSKPYTELEYKKGNATKDWNDAKEAFEKLDNMVKEQEKLEEKIAKATQDLSDVEHADTELAKAETRKTELTTEIADQNKIVNDFSTPIGKATNALSTAQDDFDGARLVFTRKKCENSADSECPAIKDSFTNAETALTKAQNDLNNIKGQKGLAEVKLQELKDEDSKLPDRIDRLKGYKEEKDYHNRTISNKLKELKDKQAEFKPLEENKQSNETAAADFATATETLHRAQTALNEYDKAGITSVKDDAMEAFGYFRMKEDNRNKLNSELGAMRKHLTDLQKELDKKNVCLEGIKRKINELTAAEAKRDPATG